MLEFEQIKKNYEKYVNFCKKYLNDDNIVIIEWPEYIKKILPDDIINIYIEHISEFKRKIKILS